MRIIEKQPYLFEGIDGIKQLYRLVASSWKPKDMYYIVSAHLESFSQLEQFFIDSVHKQRIQDRVVLKMIINKGAERYGLIRKNMPFTQIKYIDTATTAEYGILNDFLFIVNYTDKPYAVLIKDHDLTSTFI